jgi:DNA mismatch repair protein MutS
MLSGTPRSRVPTPKAVLAELEAEDRTSPARRLIDDLPLFTAAARAPAPPRPDAALAAVRDALAALNLDDPSPREALEALYRLKLLAAEKEG